MRQFTVVVARDHRNVVNVHLHGLAESSVPRAQDVTSGRLRRLSGRRRRGPHRMRFGQFALSKPQVAFGRSFRLERARRSRRRLPRRAGAAIASSTDAKVRRKVGSRRARANFNALRRRGRVTQAVVIIVGGAYARDTHEKLVRIGGQRGHEFRRI